MLILYSHYNSNGHYARTAWSTRSTRTSGTKRSPRSPRTSRPSWSSWQTWQRWTLRVLPLPRWSLSIQWHFGVSQHFCFNHGIGFGNRISFFNLFRLQWNCLFDWFEQLLARYCKHFCASSADASLSFLTAKEFRISIWRDVSNWWWSSFLSHRVDD